jgi:hypothetical protein
MGSTLGGVGKAFLGKNKTIICRRSVCDALCVTHGQVLFTFSSLDMMEGVSFVAN